MTPVTWTRKWPGGRGGGGPCAFTRLRQRLEKLSGFEEIICMFYLQFRWRPETRNVFVNRWHMSLFPQCKEYDQFDLVFQKWGDNPQDLLSLHRPLVWCIIKWRSPQGSRLRTWPKPGCNTKFLSNSRSFENVLTRPFLINKKFLMSWRLDHIKGFLLMSTLTIPLTLTLTIPLTSTWGVFINYVFQ
jgi:hypothetical protein